MSFHMAEPAEMSLHRRSESSIGFPSFKRLPYDLREQIWETAMAEANFKHPRIHYYSLYNIDDQGIRHSELQNSPGLVTKEASPSFDESDELNWPIQTDNSIHRRAQNMAWTRTNRFRSYYASDSLLSACSESRSVYLRRFGKLFPGHQQLSLHVVSSYDGQNEVYTHVNELMDILCLSFRPEDLEAAAVSLQWDVLLSSLPFFSARTVEVVNIAFEFDSSWNNNLPGSWEIFRHEPSPRGLFARAVWDWAHGKLPEQTRVWLIDHTWKPPPEYFLVWRDITNYMLPGDLIENRPKAIIDDRSVYMNCKIWRDDTPEFAASAVALIWRLTKWYDELRHQQTHFNEEEDISSWNSLPWNRPLCAGALFEVPAHKMDDWFMFRP
jgi:2EXR family protein